MMRNILNEVTLELEEKQITAHNMLPEGLTLSLIHIFEITAVSQEGLVMALKHKEYDIHGIQFHPESVLTPDGKAMIANRCV